MSGAHARPSRLGRAVFFLAAPDPPVVVLGSRAMASPVPVAVPDANALVSYGGPHRDRPALQSPPQRPAVVGWQT
ncbi:hypothetical protein ACFQ0G_53530 [Streptomyces chiangmaiensis]|uniref:hypothetical protein n=1 Tax=Streptomyces chiangmaiensis TaxID=766497 RepID=UPI0031F11D9A